MFGHAVCNQACVGERESGVCTSSVCCLKQRSETSNCPFHIHARGQTAEVSPERLAHPQKEDKDETSRAIPQI